MRPSSPEIDARGRLLHLLAASGLGVAQPLYDVLARNPEFEIAHRLLATDLLALAAGLSLGIALTLWLVETLLGVVLPRVAPWLHVGLTALLLAPSPLALFGGRPTGAGARLALLAVLAAAAAALFIQSRNFRRLLSLLAVGALLFPTLFLVPSLRRHLGEDTQPAAKSPLPGAVPVVFVVLDELPLASLLEGPGSLDADRFPNFAALAATSTWFRKATTVAQTTRISLPALVTGRYPTGIAPPTHEAHPESLFTLAAAHYNLNVVETTTRLCGSLCKESTEILVWSERLPPALADLTAIYLALVTPGLGPPVDDGWTDYWAADTSAARSKKRQREAWQIRRFAAFVRGLKSSPRVTFHFLHLPLPHAPWRFLPDGQSYRREEGRAHGFGRTNDGDLWDGSEWEVVQAQQRHLVQLQYVDTLLGEILDALRERELFDDALIVVTADHGASFQHGERRRALTEGNLVEIAHVPLFVKQSGQVEEKVDDRNVESIDIAPTLAAAMALESPGPIDGIPLAGPQRGETKTVFRSAVKAGTQERWSYPISRLADTNEHVRTRNARFPEPSLYLIGDDRHLVGRSIESFPQRPAHAGLTLEYPNAFDDIDLTSWVSPAHVMGRLHLDAPIARHQRLVIALDGIVRAVTETYGLLPARKVEFSALLDPAVLRPGAQRLAVYLVEADGGLSPAAAR